MALERRLRSDLFPYLPLTITVRGRSRSVLALLDTGFDGECVVPVGFFDDVAPPDNALDWTLADGTRVNAPAYIGFVQVGELATLEVMISTLGDEAIVGRGISDHFTVTLDHGRTLIVEP